MLARVDGKSPAEYLTESERLLAAPRSRRASCSSRRLRRRLGRARGGAQVSSTRIAAVFAWEALDSRGTRRRVRGSRRLGREAASRRCPPALDLLRQLRTAGTVWGGKGVRCARRQRDDRAGRGRRGRCRAGGRRRRTARPRRHADARPPGARMPSWRHRWPARSPRPPPRTPLWRLGTPPHSAAPSTCSPAEHTPAAASTCRTCS